MGRTAKEILEQSQVVAVVGISQHERKESHRVPKALQSIGFTIVPVHPTASTILDEVAFPSVAEVSATVKVDVVESQCMATLSAVHRIDKRR